MSGRFVAAVSWMAVLLAGCQFDPFSSEYTTIEPSKESIVGTYSPDASSRRHFLSRYKVDISSTLIRFDADATFQAVQLPNCWREFGCSGGLQTVSGTWSVSKHQDWWAIGLRARSIDGKREDFGTEMMLRGEKEPYVAHFTIGDPDAGEVLAFEKATAR